MKRRIQLALFVNASALAWVAAAQIHPINHPWGVLVGCVIVAVGILVTT